jgi:hypothetical protein
MLALYRRLLYLYPSAHRCEFGEEMLGVFREVEAENSQKSLSARAAFCAHEVGGLLSGALQERFRSIAGFRPGPILPTRRFTMHSEFRFPKTTAFLMTVILAGVVLAIDKAEAIQVSLPHTNPPVGPIQPAQFVFFPTIALMFAGVYAAGIAGWAILFALRRSGVHRLSETTGEAQK